MQLCSVFVHVYLLLLAIYWTCTSTQKKRDCPTVFSATTRTKPLKTTSSARCSAILAPARRAGRRVFWGGCQCGATVAPFTVIRAEIFVCLVNTSVLENDSTPQNTPQKMHSVFIQNKYIYDFTATIK